MPESRNFIDRILSKRIIYFRLIVRNSNSDLNSDLNSDSNCNKQILHEHSKEKAAEVGTNEIR